MGHTSPATRNLDTIGDALAALSRQAQREPVLLAGAALGFALAVIAAVVMLVHGPTIGAEGHVDRAMTFNFAVGLYYLTLAVLAPLAQMSNRRRRIWLTMQAALLPLFFGIENVQVYRGIDPRFTEVGSVVDQAIGAFFGLTALAVIALFVVLAVRWFRRPIDGHDRLLLLGVRYGAISTIVAFGAGIGMSVVGGSAIGQEGDLLLVHALGFHGLQAVPLVGWLSIAGADAPGASRRVHVACIAWLIATAAVGYQAASNQPSFIASPANAVAIVALLASCVVIADAARLRFASPQLPNAAGSAS